MFILNVSKKQTYSKFKINLLKHYLSLGHTMKGNTKPTIMSIKLLKLLSNITAYIYSIIVRVPE